MQDRPTYRPVYKAIHRPLTVCGVDRRLFFLSLLMGWATATECAAWGVLGSLAIAWWQGSLSRESFWASVMGATRVNCMILLILAGASYMGTSMAYTGIPLALATWMVVDPRSASAVTPCTMKSALEPPAR